MPTRVVAGALTWMALCGVLLGACDTGESDGTQAPPGGRPQLVVPGTPSEIEVQMPTKAQQSYVHGSFPVCLDEPGEVEVTSVWFHSGDMQVTDWAVRPIPEADEDGTAHFAGDWRGATLESRGIENAEVLTRTCDGSDKPYEVILELRAGESSTHGDRAIVQYASGGREGRLALTERVVLCVRPDSPPCM